VGPGGERDHSVGTFRTLLPPALARNHSLSLITVGEDRLGTSAILAFLSVISIFYGIIGRMLARDDEAWIEIHGGELMEDWKLAVEGQPARAIDDSRSRIAAPPTTQRKGSTRAQRFHDLL